MLGVYSGCSISQRVTLIACGAAGGIAATFNTPIGGMVFAIELMLPASNSRTLMPLGITAVVATYIGRAALGLHPAFDVPTLEVACHTRMHTTRPRPPNAHSCHIPL